MNDQTAAFLGQGINIGAEIAQTKQQRKWQLQDYERQKADQREFWDITNKFNSPEEQMNRLRQAGLNPHLIYGKGADVTASSLSGPTMGNAPKASVKFDYSQIMQAKAMNQQIKQGEAQTDNVYADTQNKVLQQSLTQAQINQTDAMTANYMQQTASNKFQMEQAMRNADSIYEKIGLENESLKIKNVTELGRFELEQVKSASDKSRAIQEIAESKSRVLMAQLQNARAQELQPYQVDKLKEEIRSMNAIINNHNLDADIKRFEIEMRRQGTSFHDNSVMRKLWSFLSSDSKQTATEAARWKKLTYGGRPGFDSEGNPTSLYNMLTK
jgi:hypothetical protein